MKYAVLAALFGAGAVLAVATVEGPVGEAYASPAGQARARDGSLSTVVLAGDEHGQQFVVVDADMRTMGVYHVDRDSGRISLKSVRNFKWDLQMLHWNSEPPLPEEVRSMLGQQ